MFGFNKGEENPPRSNSDEDDETSSTPVAEGSWFQNALPVFACGAGLFSDGYINNVRLFTQRLCSPDSDSAPSRSLARSAPL